MSKRYIDANKLRKDVEDLHDCYNGFSDTYDKACIIGLIDEQPTADVVKRKKGKWIIKDNPGTGWYRVTCSECGEDVTSTIPVIGFFPNAKPIWNFCPECGADMREGSNNERTD
jgi:rRNA maturation protein Nop10